MNVNTRKIRSRLAIVTGVGALLLITAGGLSAITANAQMFKGKKFSQSYVPNEVLVKFKPGVDVQAQAQSIGSFGLQKIRALNKTGWVHLKLPTGLTAEQAAAAYAADPNVEYVQPNYIYKATAIPNDPSYGQLWGLKNIGQPISNPSYTSNNPGLLGNDMDMEPAWDQITDCSSVIVAVIDSGINYTHQDLAANMWDGSAAGYPNHGFDFVDNDNDPMPTDAGGHGTHVVGTIAAVGNNGLGITGVCWSARIMAIRSLSADGGTTLTVTQGIDFARQRGARVINMSLGGASQGDQLFSDAITNARNSGILVVVAAGNEANNNDGVTAFYPCNFTHDNLVCVAALDQAYALANFSNYGSTSVDVGAPGTNVLSAWPGITITDDFTSGWTMTGGWAGVTCDFGAGPIRMLVNPSNWCIGGPYANNADDVGYKTFDLSSYVGAGLSFLTILDTEDGFDFVGVATRSTGGDPFTAGGTLLGEATGSSGGQPFPAEFTLAGCRTTTCSVGFRLRSDSIVTARGVAVLSFAINTAQTGSAVYKTIDGTSMAAPHVAGLAAMLLAYNPSYIYTDAVNSIRNGGDSVASLAGVTTTGRAVNAMGALAYINPPTGLSASVQ